MKTNYAAKATGIKLLLVVAMAGLAFLNMGGCASDGTGIGGSGIHGELNANTNLNPLTGEVGDTTVGGKIYFARRALSATEKQQIHDTAFAAGVEFIRSGGQKSAEPNVKANLVRRLSYKYRVLASKLKTLTETAFEEGARSAGEVSNEFRKWMKEVQDLAISHDYGIKGDEEYFVRYFFHKHYTPKEAIDHWANDPWPNMGGGA